MMGVLRDFSSFSSFMEISIKFYSSKLIVGHPVNPNNFPKKLTKKLHSLEPSKENEKKNSSASK
jgi:hypothetical protein